MVETLSAVASYFTVNVSSPNTPGLRDLQQAKALDDLLARVIDARERVRPRAGPTPILLRLLRISRCPNSTTSLVSRENIALME